MEVNIQTLIVWVLYQFLGLQCFRIGNPLTTRSSQERVGKWQPTDTIHILRNNIWRKRTESENTHNKIKRFFEFSPVAFNHGTEDISIDASRNDPIHFSPFITIIEGYRKYSKPQRPQPKFKSTYIKTGEAPPEHVNPYVDHFSGIKSFILHFNNHNRYDTIVANDQYSINDDIEGHIGDISMRAYLHPDETENEAMLVNQPLSFPNNKKSNDMFHPVIPEYDVNHSLQILESKTTELKNLEDKPFTYTENKLQLGDSYDEENDTNKLGNANAVPAASKLFDAITNTPKEFNSDIDDINYALFKSKNNLNKKVKMQENIYQQNSMHYQGDESLTQYDQPTQHMDGLDNFKPVNNIEISHGSFGNAMEGISPNRDPFEFGKSDSFGQSSDLKSNKFSLERTDELKGKDTHVANNFDFGRFGSIVEPTVNGVERPTAVVEDFTDADDHTPYVRLGLQSKDEFQPYEESVGSFSYDDVSKILFFFKNKVSIKYNV